MAIADIAFCPKSFVEVPIAISDSSETKLLVPIQELKNISDAKPFQILRKEEPLAARRIPYPK